MAARAPGMPLAPDFQTGYVNTAASQALAKLSERYRIGNFLRSGRREIFLLNGSSLTQEICICMAWVGNTMIEVIQPIAGEVAIYSDWLPPQGFALRLAFGSSPKQNGTRSLSRSSVPALTSA